MKKYTKGEITKIILKSLVVGTLFLTVLALPGLAQVYTLFRPKNSRDRYQLNKSIHNLKKQKLIRVYKKDNNDVIEITEKGKKKVLAYNLDDMKIKKSNKWDEWWRIVIFDIPEQNRRARSAITFKLKEMGFYPLQKSTFISPYKCKNEIDFIGNYFNVRKYLIYIKAKEIETGKQLRKHFGLE